LIKLELCKLQQLLSPAYSRLFPRLPIVLIDELSRYDSVLDLGCGPFSKIHRSNIPFSVGVELFDPYIQESKRKAIHNQYIKADIRRIEFKPRSFDAVVVIDVLEHLTKQEGVCLINKMETWAKKKVIITTPNEYLHQDIYHDNALQEHRCGWSVEELRGLGFKVRGMNGWKKLRGSRGVMKYRPIVLWEVISDLTQKIIYYYPKLAFQLHAVKQTDPNN